MDGEKMASLAIMSGITGLTLNFGTIAAGVVAAVAIAGTGYAAYRIGSAACKKISALKSAEKLVQDGPELAI